MSIDREEVTIGMCCVAAPITRDGVPEAAVSVTGPVSQMRPQQLADAVRTAAHGISQQLSHVRQAIR